MSPEELQERARNLCVVLRKDSAKPVPLPKLNVIARAKLAVMSIGLMKVLECQRLETGTWPTAQNR